MSRNSRKYRLKHDQLACMGKHPRLPTIGFDLDPINNGGEKIFLPLAKMFRKSEILSNTVFFDNPNARFDTRMCLLRRSSREGDGRFVDIYHLPPSLLITSENVHECVAAFLIRLEEEHGVIGKQKMVDSRHSSSSADSGEMSTVMSL